MFWEVLDGIWHLFMMVVAVLVLVEIWQWTKWWFGWDDNRKIR